MRRAASLLVLGAFLLAGCVAPDTPAPAPAAPHLSCAPCTLTLAATPDALWEPHVAANPADDAHLVAAVAVLGGDTAEGPFAHGMLVATTRDGGATWTSTRIPHGPTAGPGHPLAGSRALADPNVAFLPDGTVLVSGLAYNLVAGPAGGMAQGFRIFVARSTDGGDSFPDIAIVVADTGVASIGPLGHRGAALHAPDAPTMAVAPDGRVHLLWRTMVQASPDAPERSVMMASSSADGARTWAAPRPIETGGINAVASQLVATRDGTLLAAVGGWGEGGVTETAEGYQMLARSTDGGANWNVAVLDDQFASGIAWWPTVAEGPQGVLFAYPVPDAEGREAVAVRVSSDAGATFGPRVEVTSRVASGHAMPTLAGDGARAFLTWFQPQEDGATRNHLYAVALGAGATVSEPVLLDGTLTTDATSLGEYFGMAVADGRAVPVWTNNEDGGRLLGASLISG